MNSPAAFGSFLVRCFFLPGVAALLAGCPVYSKVTTSTSTGASVMVTTDSLTALIWPGPAMVTGSAKPATETRAVGAFSKIKVDGDEDVEVGIGPATAVTVTTDDNVLPAIETTVEGDTLHIRPRQSFRSTLGVKIKITTPALESVDVSGACDLRTNGLDAAAFALDISGCAHAHLDGKSAALDVRLSGAGGVEASALTAKRVKIDVSGVANAEVCATESLDATISGVGVVHYRGNPPEVSKNVSGIGSIQEE